MLLLGALGLRNMDMPAADPVMSTLRNVVTYDTDVDGVLGRLYFVSNEVTETMASPVMGRVVARQEENQSLGILCTQDLYARAVLSGVVESVTALEHGTQITLRHNDGLRSCYTAVEGALVREGDNVVQGSMLGVVQKGTQGRVLYFSLSRNGQPMDPQQVFSNAVQE